MTAYKLIVCAELTHLGGTQDTLALVDVLQALDNAGDTFAHCKDPEDWSNEFRGCLLSHLVAERHGWLGPCVETYMLPLLIDAAYDEVALLAQPPLPHSPSPSSDGEAVPPHRLRRGHSLTCGQGCSVSVVENPAPCRGRLRSRGRGCSRGLSSAHVV
jgi:hypothetical protein